MTKRNIIKKLSDKGLLLFSNNQVLFNGVDAKYIVAYQNSLQVASTCNNLQEVAEFAQYAQHAYRDEYGELWV